MGRSFTSFRGYGFWARDGQLAAWMANLVREIDKLPQLTPEQRAFRNDLIFRASLSVPGAVSDCLNHVDRSEVLREWIVEIGQRALQEYVRWGEAIDGSWLNSLMSAEGSVDTGRHFSDGPIPSDLHISYAENWLQLLEGNFVPLPLSPWGRYHGNGEIEVDLAKLKGGLPLPEGSRSNFPK